MDLDKWDITFISVVVFIGILACVVILLHTTYALQIVAPRQEGNYPVYNIHITIKINGHPVEATMDTGTDFTLIPQSYASSLGLENGPTSSIIGSDVPFSGINGGSKNLHSTDVQMTIENSRPFNTGVLLNQGDNPPVILLSLHDLYQAYRLSFVPIR